MKKYAPKVSRYILGLIFFVFGLIGLLNLIPPPPDMPANLKTFMDGLMVTGYFMKLLKLTEVICGLMLLGNFAPALALVILAPISINIFLVHLTLTPGLENLIIPVVVVATHIMAATAYWDVYRPMIKRK